MPTIHLTIFIEAPANRVFDLSRSIDLHKESMKKYGEEAVSGTRFGLIENGESVTWQAKHIGKKRMLKSKITAMNKPESFTDEQTEGAFKMMKHEHFFKPAENGTFLIDYFHYELPYAGFGKFFDAIYLHKYITRLLEERNAAIKKAAEGDGWRRLLEK